MQELPNNIIIILGASVFLLLISLFIVLILMAYKKRDFEHLKEKKKLEQEFSSQLLQSQMEVQEQTFQQIGKELHDNVGQLLSTSRMLIGLTERALASPPDTLITANATLAKAINEVRSLSKSLDKDWLEKFSFIDNLNAEINRINATKSIIATLNIGHNLNLQPEKQLILFRIVQEAIQNAIKHGNCRYLSIESAKKDDEIRIDISDNGKGFDPEKINKGMGLTNMKHRTGLLGGQIQYRSANGEGTTVTILVPDKNIV